MSLKVFIFEGLVVVSLVSIVLGATNKLDVPCSATKESKMMSSL
jgi:hypothetical protein